MGGATAACPLGSALPTGWARNGAAVTPGRTLNGPATKDHDNISKTAGADNTLAAKLLALLLTLE